MDRMHQTGMLAAAALLVASCSGGGSTPTISSNPPSPIPDIKLAVVATGFTFPVHIAAASNDNGRLYVVEQAGRIQMIEQGATTLFLDISN